jgi:hypothetical protein
MDETALEAEVEDVIETLREAIDGIDLDDAIEISEAVHDGVTAVLDGLRFDREQRDRP